MALIIAVLPPNSGLLGTGKAIFFVPRQSLESIQYMLCVQQIFVE